jgi:hypothetical protein
MAIFTGRRCTTLVKLPVALSALSTENSEPVAGAISSTVPVSCAPSRPSTVKRAGWPMRTWAVWVSLKLATTHSWGGTTYSSWLPAATYWPLRTVTSLTCPSLGACTVVLSRLMRACCTWASAICTAACRASRFTVVALMASLPMAMSARALSTLLAARRAVARTLSRSFSDTEPRLARSSTRRSSAWARSDSAWAADRVACLAPCPAWFCDWVWAEFASCALALANWAWAWASAAS